MVVGKDQGDAKSDTAVELKLEKNSTTKKSYRKPEILIKFFFLKLKLILANMVSKMGKILMKKLDLVALFWKLDICCLSKGNLYLSPENPQYFFDMVVTGVTHRI